MKKEDIFTLATFRRMWNKHYEHVKTIDQARFTKCSECVELKEVSLFSVDVLSIRDSISEQLNLTVKNLCVRFNILFSECAEKGARQERPCQGASEY